MKIESSRVQMAASHLHIKEYRLSERLEVWQDRRAPAAETVFSPRGRELQQQDAVASAGAANPVAEEEQLSPRLHMIKQLIEYLTGRPIHLLKMASIDADTGPAAAAAEGQATAQAAGNRPAGWGVDYQREEYLHQVQSVAFSAEGHIRTSDGLEFSFRAELLLASEFTQHASVHVEMGDGARRKKDPLVINYQAPAAHLKTETLDFDIDADGSRDTLRQLGSGSAYLALDRNGDGRINDGSELFGTASGDGFADLARADGDGNGWIDENDAIYGQLRLWLQDVGDGSLLTLKQADVGAIFLGRVATPFELGGSPQDAGGELVSSGLFLKDSGGAGSVQQIDLYA